MLISQYNSSKITVLNSLLIMMVLYIHSYYLEGEQYQGALAVQRLLSGNAICGTANRLFFFISGMLFFNGITKAADCLGKMRKRVRTLLVPYLIWNVIFVLWYVVLHFVPGVKSFVNSDMTSQFSSLWQGIYTLWIMPASFPLWFLRDLICMVALSPIIWLYIKHFKLVGVILFMLISLFYPNSATFFVLGAAVTMLWNLEKLQHMLSKPVVYCSIAVFMAGCLYVCLQPASYEVPRVLDFVLAFSGMIATWRGYDMIARGRCLAPSSAWAKLMGYSFFIYLFHEPTFNIIKKLPIRLLGDSEPVVIAFFLINPIIMALVAIGVAKCLQKLMPKIYSILVGGR